MSTPEKKPTFSVIIAVNDQAEDLRANLPILLSQQYEGYEVIIVDESSADESAEVLKQLKEEYPHLYTTFLPKYHFQKNRRRLAFTIGLKAAKSEWLIFTDITIIPVSEQWLAELEEFTCKPMELLLGYINKKNGDIRLRTFESIDQASKIVSKAERWRAGAGHDRWMRTLQKSTRYDFIAVRADLGHELLRLFALDPWLLVSKER